MEKIVTILCMFENDIFGMSHFQVAAEYGGKMRHKKKAFRKGETFHVIVAFNFIHSKL